MSDNLVNEVASREAERYRAEWGGDMPGGGLPEVRRYVGMIVADVLDILIRDGRFPAAIEPGPCWHDPGVVWADEAGMQPRCELRAGHAGAHECDRGTLGGTAVWTDETPDGGAR